MSKLDEYRDAQAVIEQLRQIQAAVERETEGTEGPHLRLNLKLSGQLVDNTEVLLYGPDNAAASRLPIGRPAESLLAQAIRHHLAVIVETARGLAGANLMESRAQAALEAAATLTELQPVEDLAEGA